VWAVVTAQPQIRTWRQRVGALHNLPLVFKILWESASGLVSASLGVRVINAVLPLATLWVSKLIIDFVVSAARHSAPVPARIWWLVAAEFVIAGAGATLGRAVWYLESRLADEFSREVSLRIMRHAGTLDLATFEDPVFYDMLERARAQSSDRVALLNAMGSLVQQTLMLISFSAGVIVFYPPLFLLLVTCLIPAFLGETHFAFLGYSLAHSLTPVRRELDYLRVLGTSRESAKEIKLFDLGRYLHDRFAALNGELIARNQRLLLRRFSLGSVLTLIGSLGYYASYAYLVSRALQGRMTVGDLTFMAGALAGTSSQVQSVFSTFAGIADDALFLTDLHRFLAVTPRIRPADPGLPVPRPIRDGFEFRKVSFHYPGTDRPILDRLDLRIAPGERLALVGENGQGKTTLVKLLTHLYEPTSGQILLDGVDLREYSAEVLQREIGVIFQDFVRYDMTARQNIGLGRIDRLDDEACVFEAAWRSRATDIVARLPTGFDQMLGRRFEGGVDLSGGEWQKFALARAYMRDAQILILDEPTAALDAASEYELFQRFATLTEGRMAILISHRFSTVRMCDRIVVLEGGAIREQGSHRELLARGGCYARLFQMQASQYV
jgi:ATP-binding cassette subfamily B protein